LEDPAHLCIICRKINDNICIKDENVFNLTQAMNGEPDLLSPSVFFGFLAVLGFFGNILVLFVYSVKYKYALNILTASDSVDDIVERFSVDAIERTLGESQHLLFLVMHSIWFP
jgi:hypothetical protein